MMYVRMVFIQYDIDLETFELGFEICFWDRRIDEH